MLVAKIIIRNSTDKPLKKIVERLYYKSKELIVKNSIDQYYMEEISLLRKQLEEQNETARKLLSENSTLRKTIKSQHETIQYSKNKSLSTMGDSFYENKLTTKIAPFLKFLKIFDEDPDYLINNIQIYIKQLLSCDAMIVLTRKNEREYEGTLSDKRITFNNMEKYLSSSNGVIINAVSFDDEIGCKVQAVYSIKNYLVIPYKSYKQDVATEFLVFMNKKGILPVFSKSDEMLGSLACCLYFMVQKHYKILNKYNELKKNRIDIYNTIYELLSFVNSSFNT